MELVVNIWPIADSGTGIIQRFAARAYAMAGTDDEIAGALKSMSKTDYILARQFPIPQNFSIISEHGELSGAVDPGAFNEYQARIIEEALRELEKDLPKVHGVGVDSSGNAYGRRMKVGFPEAPYFVVTYLIEDANGNLDVYSKV